TVYQWDELMCYSDVEEAQGLCSPGWYVPSESDWNILFTIWTNNAFAGAPLKYSGYSGFNALLTGVELFNKVWEFDAFATFFWSSSSHEPFKAWAHGMNEYNYSVSYYPSFRANAFGVRFLKD
ncbi:MAG: FISUMP domain-containing protein, partial [Bacteroidota bacterium]